MKIKITTLQELKKAKWIILKDMKWIISHQEYYNIINWVHTPRFETKANLCGLFEIHPSEFEKLLKWTLKLNK